MGRIIEVVENKNITGLGFQQGSFNANVKTMQEVFHSGEFIHSDDQHLAAVIEDDDEDEACANFVTHGQTYINWVAVDIPVVVRRSM